MGSEKYDLSIYDEAQEEIREIARAHLELVGPISAGKVMDRLYDAMDQLTLFPLSRPLLRDPTLARDGYRAAVAGKYMILYRLVERTVVVYHVVHGRRNYPAILQERSTGRDDP